jgi:hypothetical protein
LLATGQVPTALDTLQKQGRVREISDVDERIRAIAKSYIESPEKTLIVSPDTVFQSLAKGDVSALGWFDEKWMVALGSLSINGMQLRFGNSSVHGPSPARCGTPSAPDAAYP